MLTKRPIKVLVIGSINMDLVLNLKRTPEAGETVLGETYSYIPGGKGANQAVAAARLNGNVTMCGRVGKDSNGELLIRNLSANNVNTNYITMDEKAQTGLAVIPVDSEGENRIMVFSGSNGRVSRADIDNAFLESYDVVMMQLETPLDIVYYAYEKATAKGIPFVLDTGPAIKMDLSKLKGIYIISPNESEASFLTGIQVNSSESAVQAARKLHEVTYASYILIKLGDKGALLYENGNYEIFPAFKVKTVDSTAAGDSFIAAVVIKMMEYGDIRKAVQYANAVGALCVSKHGAQPSLPTAAEVTKFLYSSEIFEL